MEDKKWKTNWAKCCLCQKDKKEDLKSPASNPATREKDGYHNIATNVPLFLVINSLLIALDPERLDEGNGIEETLRDNNAMYHQSCRSLFSNTKLERARKRSVCKSAGLFGEGRSKKQRKSVSKDVCFLCDEEEKEGVLRKASAMKLNERLNQCSRILIDGKLLALLSAGDAVAQDLMYHAKCLASLYKRVRSISYDRVLEISSQLRETVVDKYLEEGIVCSLGLKKGIFTVSAMDNTDHNPTFTTAQSSFHGTSISVFQHPGINNVGETRKPLEVGEGKTKKVPQLPESYINIKPAFLKEDPKPLVCTSFLMPNVESITTQEFVWLEKVNFTDEVDNTVKVTWSAHHASQKRANLFKVAISSLLPLLRDGAHSVATIKHVMDIILDIVTYLNPSQIPVVAADQPLYALAKQIQWQWPENGDNKFVIIFGGLHVIWRRLGQLEVCCKAAVG